MRYRFLSDSHTHSDCSRDGTDPVMMMCERAASLGLYSLTVTDHCECDTYREERYDKSIVQSFFETRKAKVVFRDRLHVYAGVELGQPLQNLPAAEETLAGGAFDFVLASIHSLQGMEDFYYLQYTEETVDTLLIQYLDELMRMVLWGRFDSLAHLTYPLRYIFSNSGLRVDLSRFQERIDAILSGLAEKQLALEINTSGLRQPIGETMPTVELVSRFKKLGGRYVTIGSDAHRWADVGAGVEEGMAVAAKAGFQHFTIYERREPRLLPIE
jgi:histidinol-phosphatase (PHP family)